MKNLYILTVLLLVSCLSEDGVSPGSSETFIRYYNGGNNDEAKGLEVAPDGGYVILATTRIQKAESDIPQFKIKLIKTDNAGNPVWQKLYPDFGTADKNYTASSLVNIPGGGFAIAGDSVGTDGSTKAFVMTVDANGDGTNATRRSFGTGNLRGKAIAVTSAGNYLVLCTSGAEKAYLYEIHKTSFALINPNAVAKEAGSTSLGSRLLLDQAGNAVWSGVVTRSTLTGVRVTKNHPNNVLSEFDNTIGIPGFYMAGSDICKFGFEYAIVGSTNRKGTVVGSDTDILFMRISANGDTLRTQSFPLDDPLTSENEDSQNDVGNSINGTRDGGLILLSSVGSAAIKGRGDSDYYLIKIDAFGKKQWTSSFGSKFKDDGVAVRQISDGSYVVLGTTTQGALKILTLLKTDKDGKIN
ncbi:MAG: hypothetical protein SH819_08240 [Cytophagales bacterium]|nr:hypothetical protein [Cytophagales bacterium]